MEKKTLSRSSSSAGRGRTSSITTQPRSTNKTAMNKRNHSSESHHYMNEMMDKLFTDQLRDIYYAEKLLRRTLHKMAKSATTETLQESLESHQEETQRHIERLENIFDLLGRKAQTKRCEAMDGLKKETDLLIAETLNGTYTRDVGLIISAQKIEHYEIAAYGCLTKLARTYGMKEVAGILHQTLEEEKSADEILTTIAEEHINVEAGKEFEQEPRG